ncbi:MAG: GFA family protein, partial [Gammaproteobacteria bacterium]
MSEPIKGACLCGRVRYQVTGPFDEFHLCHCSQCRRSTGSAHAANIFTSADRLDWLAGEELIKRYTPDAPDVISKCFCTHCGS